MQLFLFFFCLLLAHAAVGQVAVPDSALRLASYQKAVALYEQALGRQSNLYNGSEHINYDVNAEGHSFWEVDTWRTGWVRYDGILYSQTLLLYDLINDKAVVQHPDTVYRIALQSEKVARFGLGNHTFIRLDEETARQTGLRMAGFYDLLHDGPTRVLARRAKTLRSDVSDRVLKMFIDEATQYFVWQNGSYQLVRNKAALLALFKSEKKALLRHLRDQKLRFKTNREATIVQAARFHDASPGNL